MPDYVIRTWTYQDALASGLLFAKQALEVRRWAFAADAIRAYALYTEGGVYLDSDVFLKKDLTPLLNGDFVSAIEVKRDPESKQVIDLTPQPAFLASPKGHPFAKLLVDFYRNRPFVLPDGSWDMAVIAPEYYARLVEPLGFQRKDETQHFAGITIYHSQFFASCLDDDNPQAYGIHGCVHSWVHGKWANRLRCVRDWAKHAWGRLKGR
jgi:hypothetical protein